jgi:hypothetical protein
MIAVNKKKRACVARSRIREIFRTRVASVNLTPEGWLAWRAVMFSALAIRPLT